MLFNTILVLPPSWPLRRIDKQHELFGDILETLEQKKWIERIRKQFANRVKAIRKRFLSKIDTCNTYPIEDGYAENILTLTTCESRRPTPFLRI